MINYQGSVASNSLPMIACATASSYIIMATIHLLSAKEKHFPTLLSPIVTSLLKTSTLQVLAAASDVFAIK